MLTRLLLVILFIIPAFCQAQSLVLKKGDKVKTFAPETFYSFYFYEKENKKKYTHVDGTVKQILSDSIQIYMDNGTLADIDPDFLFLFKGDLQEQDLLVTMPKSQLRTFRAYKTEKTKNKNGTVTALGGILLVTGLVTAASSYDFQDKSFRKGVVLSAGVQLGLGGILSAISTKKQYKLDDGWHF